MLKSNIYLLIGVLFLLVGIFRNNFVSLIAGVIFIGLEISKRKKQD